MPYKKSLNEEIKFGKGLTKDKLRSKKVQEGLLKDDKGIKDCKKGTW